MPATSLKLSEELKQRITRLVAKEPRSAHAFMVQAIEQATEREELRRRFGEEAAQAEREAFDSGKAYDAVEVFDHLEARAQGHATRRPRMKSWRKSG